MYQLQKLQKTLTVIALVLLTYGPLACGPDAEQERYLTLCRNVYSCALTADARVIEKYICAPVAYDAHVRSLFTGQDITECLATLLEELNYDKTLDPLDPSHNLSCGYLQDSTGGSTYVDETLQKGVKACLK